MSSQSGRVVNPDSSAQMKSPSNTTPSNRASNTTLQNHSCLGFDPNSPNSGRSRSHSEPPFPPLHALSLLISPIPSPPQSPTHSHQNNNPPTPPIPPMTHTTTTTTTSSTSTTASAPNNGISHGVVGGERGRLATLMNHDAFGLSLPFLSNDYHSGGMEGFGVGGGRPRAASHSLVIPHSHSLLGQSTIDVSNDLEEDNRLSDLARLSLQITDSPLNASRLRAHSSPHSPSFLPFLTPTTTAQNTPANLNTNPHSLPPPLPHNFARPQQQHQQQQQLHANSSNNSVSLPGVVGAGGSNSGSVVSSPRSVSPTQKGGVCMGGVSSTSSQHDISLDQDHLPVHPHTLLGSGGNSLAAQWMQNQYFDGAYEGFTGSEFGVSIEGPAQECCNLFINYLPQSVDDSMLHQLFRPFGDIESCKVMLDLNTHRSRCFGFVKFSRLEDAKRAMKEMNGKRLEHKSLIVKYANTADITSMGTPSNNVYVKGLPHHFDNGSLRQLFEPYGVIEDCRVLVDVETGSSRGIAFARFSSVHEAELAIKALNNQILPQTDKPILVKFADTDDERTQRKLRQARRRKLQQMYMQNQLGPSSSASPPHLLSSLPQVLPPGLWDETPTQPQPNPQHQPQAPKPNMHNTQTLNAGIATNLPNSSNPQSNPKGMNGSSSLHSQTQPNPTHNPHAHSNTHTALSPPQYPMFGGNGSGGSGGGSASQPLHPMSPHHFSQLMSTKHVPPMGHMQMQMQHYSPHMLYDVDSMGVPPSMEPIPSFMHHHHLPPHPHHPHPIPHNLMPHFAMQQQQQQQQQQQHQSMPFPPHFQQQHHPSMRQEFPMPAQPDHAFFPQQLPHMASNGPESNAGGRRLSVELVVSALPPETTEETVRKLVGAHGNVVSVALNNDETGGGSANVFMNSLADAVNVVSNLHGIQIGGNNLQVSFKKSV